MKTKHTPGPWQVAVDELEDCTYIAGQRVEPQPKPGGNYCPVVAKILHNRTPGERQANARLIAAAPETAAERDRLKEINAELLEAVKDIVGDLPPVRGGICQWCGRDYRDDIHDGNGVFTQDSCPSDDCPHTRLGEAIAKAEASQ